MQDELILATADGFLLGLKLAEDIYHLPPNTTVEDRRLWQLVEQIATGEITEPETDAQIRKLHPTQRTLESNAASIKRRCKRPPSMSPSGIAERLEEPVS